jgi:ketosteroid isomerase-like protein
MDHEQRNLEVVARLGQLWNEGDHDAMLSLYHDDVVMTAAPNWIDPGPWVGKHEVARSAREWSSAWQEIAMSIERAEAAGDKVVCIGEWVSRGVASGAGGTVPLVILFTLEDGLIKRFEWFEDPNDALRLAGIG